MLGYKIDELKQSRVYQEARQEGREEIILMLLEYKFGQLSLQNQSSIEALDFDRLQALSTVLLGFTDVLDLEIWLQSQTTL